MVWGVIAAVEMPLLAKYIRRGLVLLMRRHKTLVYSRPVQRVDEVRKAG